MVRGLIHLAVVLYWHWVAPTKKPTRDPRGEVFLMDPGNAFNPDSMEDIDDFMGIL